MKWWWLLLWAVGLGAIWGLLMLIVEVLRWADTSAVWDGEY